MNRNIVSRALAIIMASVIVFSVSPILLGMNDAYAATASTTINVDEYEIEGGNTFYNDYLTYGSPVYSYLTLTGDGYMRLQADYDDSGASMAVYYDQDFNYLRRQKIAAELPLFGGFYDSGQNYYIVSGQTNEHESDSLEAIRVTKYDKSWKRLGSCAIKAASIYCPFNYGSCRMAMSGKMMYIYTCRTKYASADGLHHQASKAFVINTDTMTEIKNGIPSKASHSFNQFISIDGNDVITVDHGDAYPRAFQLERNTYENASASNLHIQRSTNVYCMGFPGKTGNNYTGASLGALEISDTNYLLAGNAAYRTGSTENNLGKKTRDIFVTAVNKDTLQYETRWLTALTEGSSTATTPHMIKITTDSFMVLWSRDDTIYYTFLNGRGIKTTGIYTMKGELSDCRPIINDGKVIWYTWYNNDETFYSISLADPSNTTKKTLIYKDEFSDIENKQKQYKSADGNTYGIVSAKDNTAVFIKANNTRSVTVPDTVTITGKEYKVTEIGEKAFTGSSIRTVIVGRNVRVIRKNAFNKSPAKKMILKTKMLKKAKVKGSLKGSKITKIQVKVGKKKMNKKFIKKYKKIFTKGNAGKKAKIK